MKYLKQVYSLIDQKLSPLSFLTRFQENEDVGRLIYRFTNVNNFIIIIFDGVENPHQCCFSSVCYYDKDEIYDPNYLPIDNLNNFFSKSRAALDITRFTNYPGRTWSVFNDNLDRRFDNVFKGTNEKILVRSERIASEIENIVKHDLILFVMRAQEKLL